MKEPLIYTRVDPQTATSSFYEPYSMQILGNSPRFVTGDKGSVLGIHADDYRRICACVNAMQGVSTEILEDYTGAEPSKSVLFRAIEDATMQRIPLKTNEQN